jgi:homoaconitase/3-isopropylmalate dehydratase large subunit
VERAVEWGGNVAVLSPDSRFAIANMSVEFGGIAGRTGERLFAHIQLPARQAPIPHPNPRPAGVFTPDERTAAYIAKRPSHKDEALYFKADPDAQVWYSVACLRGILAARKARC